MQIKSIVLYGKGDRKRVLDFNLGTVNIITGDSKTGKSVLIEIVDFCIGSGYNVSSGVVNDSVYWFGILLALDEGEIFIARPNPSKKATVGAQPIIFVLHGDH